MPISALQRERLERSLREHETALQSSNRPLNAVAARVHRTLVEIGRDENILALVNDFVDSSELADELRDDSYSALRARGIELPEGVTIDVVNGEGPKPVLRLEVTARNATVLVDWDPELGVSTQARRTTGS
jgi:hypothetical protein